VRQPSETTGVSAALHDLPVIEGEADATYLAQALRRAGRTAAVGDVGVASLTGGRQGNLVLSLKSDAGAYVLKTFPRASWRDRVFAAGNVEPALWAAGATRNLPAPLNCPTIDLAYHAARDEHWMLMVDVSHGIMGRGVYDSVRLKWLFAALAGMHAQYWEKNETLAALPLIPLEANIAYLTEPVVALGGRAPIEGWVKDMVDNFAVLKPFLPVFLDVLGSADADSYLDLCQHRGGWTAALAELPQTLSHGDVRRANFAPLAADNVSIFDWDLASRAPAANDLAWYWFLQVWCYPPNDGLDIADREPLREFYVARLAGMLGSRFDRATFDRSWELCWLKVFAQLAYCLIDPLMGKHGPEDVERVRRAVRRAVDEARRIHDVRVR
jgi:hypothetical protein